MAIVTEMAVADGWDSLDECSEASPSMVETYLFLAEAALRAIKRSQIHGCDSRARQNLRLN